MGGLSGVGRGIGAALSGFNQAVNQQQDYRAREQRMSLADADAKRRQRIDERDEKDWQDSQAARAAGAQFMEQDRAAYEAEQAKPVPGPTLDGAPVQRAPQPYQPNKQALLRAAQAEYDELFKRGRTDLGLKSWVQAEGLRSQFRQDAGRRALNALQTGGDFLGPLREFDDNMDDGLDMVEAKEIKGPKGERAFQIKQRRRISGEDMEPVTVSATDMELMISKNMASGAEVSKFNLQSYLENLKAKNRLAEIEARGDNTLEAIELRGDNTLENTKQRGLDQKDTARIRVSGSITAAQIRKSAGGAVGAGGKGSGGSSANFAKSETLADGRILIHLRDGTRKIATEDDGVTPMKGAAAEKMLQTLTDQVAKSLDGTLATPEANRTRAGGLLPKAPPPAAPPATPSAPANPNRLRLDAQGNLIGP